jgi:thiamine-phosphate pyrophosphorylase
MAEAAETRDAALVERIRDAAYAGVDWIQIREKDLDAGPLFQLVSGAVNAIRGGAARIIVNDRLDVAWAAHANGVHLGENSLPLVNVIRASRRSEISEFLVGASCHSLDAATRAAQDGAGYVLFGPVFATPSKAVFGAPQGLERLQEVCRSVSVPVLAIGGIDAANSKACLEAGATGIAAIRMFQDSHDLSALVSTLR